MHKSSINPEEKTVIDAIVQEIEELGDIYLNSSELPISFKFRRQFAIMQYKELRKDLKLRIIELLYGGVNCPAYHNHVSLNVFYGSPPRVCGIMLTYCLN